MQNNGSVMNGLHKISGKIAEASRPPIAAPQDNSRSHNIPAPPPAPVAAVTEAPLPQKGPEPRKTSGSLLGDALLRRYEDYLKTRRDLSARIVRETETLRIRQEELQREAERIRTNLEMLGTFAETTAATDDSVNPGDQAVFAAECRKIEHIRLELFRIAEQTDVLVNKKNSGGTSSDVSSLLPVLESISFGQLAKAGFAFFFPLIVTLILASLVLAAAVILSFNGMFVW